MNRISHKRGRSWLGVEPTLRRLAQTGCVASLVWLGIGLVSAHGQGTRVSPQGQVITPVRLDQGQPGMVVPAAYQQAAQPGAQPEQIKGIDAVGKAKAAMVEGFREGQPRLSRLGSVLGKTPIPSQKDLEEYNRFINEVVDPKNTLDLVQGRARLVVLKETPKRLQVADESVAGYNLVTPKEITILGKSVGTTVFNLWFADPQNKERDRVLSYLVRVIPDPEAKERLENVYKALQDEINQTFPNSVVTLKLVGDKLVVSGQAHDITDAVQILAICKANAPGGQDKEEASKIPVTPSGTFRINDPLNLNGTPGLEDFKVAGGPNVINLLRIPGEQQVMLRVTVAEVNRSAARSIGTNFSIAQRNGLVVFGQRTGNIAGGGPGAIGQGGAGGNLGGGNVGGALGNLAGLVAGIQGVGTNNLPVAIDNGQILLAINALRTLNYAKSLAEPNLVALNGQTANFQAGGQFPVPIVTGATQTGLQGVGFVPFGVQLNFTPYITDRDRIRLNVNAVVSTRDTTTGSNVGTSFVSGLNTRNFTTTVELREGQTLAVAGLIQNNLGTDASRVPLFGDLPVIGRAFAFDRTSAGEQELVVLITPELVHPLDCCEVPAIPGSDLFEPSDLEFYLLGRLEGRRSEGFRSPVMNDLCRIRQFHRCEQTYIFGPSGYQVNCK